MKAQSSIFSRLNLLLAGVLAISLAVITAQPALPAQAGPDAGDGEPSRVEPRPAYAATAAVSLGMPASVMLGENFSFTVTFDNTGDTPGYGPFIDMIFPVTGLDGDDGIDFISATYLGAAVESNAQTFPAAGCVSHPWARDAAGAFVQVCGTPGDKLVSLRLPFGSFVPDQPPLDVTVTASLSILADVGAPLAVRARGGYMFGETPLDDWCCGDTPILQPPTDDGTGWPSGPITPQVLTFTKSYVGPANTQAETATGPNFPRQYVLTVDIADGQTVTNLDISDLLPGNVQFIGIAAGTTGGYSVISLPSTVTPGGTLTLRYASVTGGAGTSDVAVTFDFYVPRLDSGGGEVVPSGSGNDASSGNIAWAQGDWDPVDGRDPLTPVTSDATCPSCPPLHTLQDKSIAIQKGVAVVGGGDPAPGKTLEYSLTFQVSDFFAFNGLVVTDVISDGQHVEGGFTPTLEINGNGYSLASAVFAPADFDVACNYSAAPGAECTTDNTGAPNDGTTTLTFDVSDEIISRGQDGRMVGGCVDPGGSGLVVPCDPANLGDGPTTGTVTYRAVIQENFTDTYPSGDDSVDQGDTLDNSAVISGNVLDNFTFTVTDTEADDAAAGVVLGRQSLTKTVYAINDDTNIANFIVDGQITIKPDDKVTFRLTYGLTTSDVENLTFDDYFPLPVFHVDDPAQTGGGGWSFSPVVGIPAPGVVQLGPSDSYYTYMDGNGTTGVLTPNTLNPGTQDPVVTADTAANKIVIAYADYDDTRNQPTTVDLLVSIVVSSDPFADKLFLTNQAHAYEGSTNGAPSTSDSIIQFVMTEPVLVTTKSAVWAGSWNGATWDAQPNAVVTPPTTPAFTDPSNSPRWAGTILDGTTIDSNITGVDAGDVVTFAITITNMGSSANGAFDITLQDTLISTIFQTPDATHPLNLQIHLGDGGGVDYTGDAVPDPIQFTGLGGGPAGLPDSSDDIFGNGIKLTDPSEVLPAGTAVCQAHTVGAGKNLIVITYDLYVRDDVIPGTYTNTATNTGYAGTDDGPNHVPTPGPGESYPPEVTDTADTTVVAPLAKQLVSTELDSATNANDEVVIGELVTYSLTTTVPEGNVPGAFITDHLDGGLAFVSCTSVVPSSPNVTTDLAGGFGGICAATEASGVTNNGQDIRFDLGNLTNADRDNVTAETVVITYQAVALNIAGNQSGALLNNAAEFFLNDGSGDVSLGTAAAPNVTVIEPALNIAKSASAPTADAGNPLSYTLTITQDGASQTDAYDTTLADPLPLCAAGGPSAIDNPVISLVSDPDGLLPPTPFELVGDNATGWTLQTPAGTSFDVPLGAQPIQITVSGTVAYCVSPTQVLGNTSYIYWTSLDGTALDRSTFNPDSDERTGADGVGLGLNNYADSATVNVTINSTTPQKYLVATSEGHTAEPVDPYQAGSGSPVSVAIGEIIRYRLAVVLPEGTSTNFRLQEYIPNGITFLNDGTAKAAFVSTGGITSTDYAYPAPSTFVIPAVNDPNCQLAGSAVTGLTPAVPALCPALADFNVSNSPTSDADTYNTSTDVSFMLGTLQNNDSDADAEYVIVEFNALVDNNGGANSNDAGETHYNRFRVYINSLLIPGYSNGVYSRAVEPSITDLTKTANPTSGDAGDVITYTLDFTNASAAPAYDTTAFDVVVTDIVHADMTLDLGSITVTSACATGVDTTNSAGNNLDVRFDSVPAGCAVTIEYTATINVTVTADQALPNTANLTYTSLPGTNGTTVNPTGSSTPGASGTTNGERNGTGVTPPNDYNDSASAQVTAHALSLVKSLVDSTNGDTLGNDLTIGEIVTYRLATALPEGTSLAFTVYDTLPAGFTYAGDPRLSFIATDPMTVDADLSGADNDALPPTFSIPAGRVSVTGQDITISLGDLVNNDRDNADVEYVVIEFDVLVNDTADNNNTDLDHNEYTVTIDGALKGPSNQVETRIVEPFLNVAKSADDDTWLYGQTVTYTLDISHITASGVPANDSNSVAYDILVTDTLPTGLTFGSVTSLPANWTQSYTAPDLTLSCLSVNGCSLPLGSSAQAAFTVTVDNPPAPPALTGTDSAANYVNMTWTSMPGDNSDERDGSGGVDDYLDFASHTGGLEYYSLGNRVWFDTDNSSTINGTEFGVDGVTVELYSTADLVTPLATDTTVNGGYYLFDYLEAGDYIVVIPASNFASGAVLESYWSSGTSMDGFGVISEAPAPDADTDIDSDDNGTLQAGPDFPGAVASLPVTLGPAGLTEPAGETDLDGGFYGEQPDGRANMTVDFGFYRTEIGNLVFLDNNVNGLYDAGDTLLNGMAVELYAADGVTLLDTFTTTTITTDGEYRFTGLPEGDYIVKASGPAGTISTRDDADSADNANPDTNTDNNDNGIGTALGQAASGPLTMDAAETAANITVTDASGTTTDLTVDFGFAYPYALGNRVWFDTDNSSTINGTEVGVDGVTVELFSASDLVNPVATDVTANGGYYLFDDLFPGDYVVVIPAANFAGGAVLEGYWSSATSLAADGSISETAAPDGDDDVDSDDNGTLQPGGDVVSSPVTLGLSGLTEPVGESDLEAGVGQGSQPDGRANMTVDFGFYRTEIGNLVFSDINKNGVFDAGDAPLDGLTVQLYSSNGTEINAGADGILNTADDAPGGMLTSGGGLYRFSGLPEGDYVVRATGPASFTSTIDTFDSADNANPDVNTDHNDNGIGTGAGQVSAGTLTMDAAEAAANIAVTDATGTTTDLTVDFGFLNTYALGNRVWFDTDNSSTLNGTEVGVDDVTVELYAADASGLPTGPALDTDTTANGGYYLFDYLDAGDYVVVIPSANFAGGAVLEGYWSSGTTMDGFGVISEAAAPDADTDLDSDDNGTLQIGGDVTSSAVTLGPGASEPVGETDLEAGVGQGSQPDDQANMTVDFGFYRTSLGNQVFYDDNFNGNYEAGTDTPLPGVTVRLFSSGGVEINVGPDGILGTLDDAPGGMATGAGGDYLFTGLPEGSYTVSVTAPANTASTIDTFDAADTANPDTNTDDNDNGLGTGGGDVPSGAVALTPGSAGAQANNQVTDATGTTHNPTVDFGFVNLYALGNRVWFDTDNSAAIDGAEVGVDGVAVDLYMDDGAGNFIYQASDITANGGYYLFDSLYPGDYMVVVTAANFGSGAVLEGYWSSQTTLAADGSISETPAPDGDNDLDSDDNGTLQTGGAFSGAVTSLPLTLGPVGLTEPTDDTDEESGVGQGLQPNGRANLSLDFGFYTTGIGNQLFGDVDKDGAYSAGDTDLGGVAVLLYSSNGTEINIGPDGMLNTADDAPGGTPTNAGGQYHFSGLPQGSYIVRTTAPTGTVSTNDNADLNDTTTTGPDANTDHNDNGQGTGGGVVTSGTLALIPGSTGAQGNTTVDNATGATHNPTVDFGFTTVYALGNRVWFDTDNSSTINGTEVGVDGVLVELYAADASGNPAGPALGTDTTANGGYYLFDFLESGDYVVVIPAANFVGGAVLEGYWSSATFRAADGSIYENPAPDADTDVDSDDNGTLQIGGVVLSQAVTLGPGGLEPISEADLEPGVGQGSQPDAQANMTVDFGFYTIQLGNLVWNDANNSGTEDGETGIPGVDVELRSADGSALLVTAVTDASGNYTFTGLPQGDYLLRLPAVEFNPGGTLRDYVSSTGGGYYEPAPDSDVDTTDSDDNGSEVGSVGLGGYIQSEVVTITPAGEQSFDNATGSTTEFRVDFGVFNAPRVNLTVTKDDGVSFYTAGGTLTYSITVTNQGPSDAFGMTVSDPRPAQITSWTWTCESSSPDPDPAAYACTGDASNPAAFGDSLDLPLGASVTYRVEAQVDPAATGALTNTVTVAPPAGMVELESSDNEASDTDDEASLRVTKDDGLVVVGPGNTLTYDILVENNGAVDLTSLTVTDTLPAGVTFVSAAPVPSSVAGRVVTWSGLSLASGADMNLSITVTVKNNPGPTLLNRVEVEDSDTGASDSDTDEDTTVSGGNLTKTMVATDQSFTSGTEVAIGEIVTYELTLTVPALGRMDNALLVDTLQTGLAFVDCADITASSGLLTSTRIDLQAPGNCNDGVTPGVHNPLVENSGGRVTFDFDTLENGSAAAETITIRYDVIVLDIGSNQEGSTLTNAAAWTWDGGQLEITTPPVEIVEPDLSIDKSAEPEVAPYGTPINFTVRIAHTKKSNTNAYDVVVTDELPTGLDYVPNSASVTGRQPTAFSYDAARKTLTFTWDDFPLGAESTIKFQAAFVGPSPVTNGASVAWTSLPIDFGPNGPVVQSPYNSDSTERWYDPADNSGVDGYGAEDSITISVPGLPETGFAPDRITALPPQPADKAYAAMDEMRLEVPKLGLANLPIVGVPLNESGWDLTWLSGQAGWLEGTAYPTWPGNTAITGHTYLADGTPGPFVNLFSLFWGDEIVIHANGQRYVYQVREVRLVWADDLSVLRHEDYDWITLITCKEFNEATGEYNYRVVVRAVLVSVQPGP